MLIVFSATERSRNSSGRVARDCSANRHAHSRRVAVRRRAVSLALQSAAAVRPRRAIRSATSSAKASRWRCGITPAMSNFPACTEEMKDPQRTFVRVLAWNTPLNILTYTLPATLALAVLGNWQDWQTGYIVTASRLHRRLCAGRRNVGGFDHRRRFAFQRHHSLHHAHPRRHGRGRLPSRLAGKTPSALRHAGARDRGFHRRLLRRWPDSRVSGSREYLHLDAHRHFHADLSWQAGNCAAKCRTPSANFEFPGEKSA